MKQIGWLTEDMRFYESDETLSQFVKRRPLYERELSDRKIAHYIQFGVLVGGERFYPGRTTIPPHEKGPIVDTYVDDHMQAIAPADVVTLQALDTRLKAQEQAMQQLIHALLPEEAKRIEELMKRLEQVERGLPPFVDANHPHYRGTPVYKSTGHLDEAAFVGRVNLHSEREAIAADIAMLSAQDIRYMVLDAIVALHKYPPDVYEPILQEIIELCGS